MSNRCHVSGKVQLEGASYIRKVIIDMERRNGHPMYAYDCRCGYVHLTSDGASKQPGYIYKPARKAG